MLNMKSFAERHPIVFEIMLIVAAFVLAAVFGLACDIVGFPKELCMAMGRIMVGFMLLIAFRRRFDIAKQFMGWLYALPALGFVLWNVVNNFFTGGKFCPPSIEFFILGFAPGIFEEVVFRGVFVSNLKAAGKSDFAAVMISALGFGVIHLTNAVGDVGMLQVLVQVSYAVVVGMVFGAIFIRTGNIISIIVVHAAIDISCHVFNSAPCTTALTLAAFVAVLAVEAVYALMLTFRKPDFCKSCCRRL